MRDWRKFPAGMVAIALLNWCVVIASCAHQPALVVTGDSLHAAALGFEATAAGLASANQLGLLKPEQRAAWNAFLPKFKASFHLACDLWRAARDAGDETLEAQASAAINTLLQELAPFTAIMLLAHPPPDAGVALELRPSVDVELELALGGAP